MRARSKVTSSFLALGLLLVMLSPLASTSAEDGDEQAVDPFGEPEGPIPFPLYNVSGSFDEDRFPYIYSDPEDLRVIWNKGARGLFTYHVVQRAYDGGDWQQGEDWVSVTDPSDQDFEAHEHYSHEGVAAMFDGLVHFVFASDDPSYTNGTDHDIVLRTLDPATGEWGDVVEVTPTDEGQDRDPRVAVLGDRLVIAWRTADGSKADGTDEDVVLRTYDGAAFSAIVPISQDGDEVKDAALDMEVVGSRVSMAWESVNTSNGPSDFDVLYREWDGQAFTGPPLVLSYQPERSDKLPKVASVDGVPFVVWESRPEAGSLGAVGIRGRVVEDGVPGEAVEVTRSGSPKENVQPDVVAAGERAYVLWSTFDDSLAHGNDSDIVMRWYDGEVLGDVVEVSHPRDGDRDEGFVTACIYEGELWAAWRMLYFIDPPVPYSINEDIVARRLSQDDAEVELMEVDNPRAGENVTVRVTVTKFHGGVASDVEDLELRVSRDGQVLPGTVPLASKAPGVFEGQYEPEEAGRYRFIAVLDGRERSTLDLSVLEGEGDGDGGSSSTVFIAFTVVALVAVFVAILYSLKRD